jgi:branched-subunit amino acid transport protein
MTHNVYVYIVIAGLVTYLIRILPLTLIRKPIKNKFIRSFLHYVPYVTLSVMTFPAILYATGSPLIGGLAMAAGVVSAWFGANSFVCAVVCSGSVFLLGLFL